MHTINGESFTLRTDLLIDELGTNKQQEVKTTITTDIKNVKVEEIKIDENMTYLNKKPGYYKTVSFEDITDKDNYKMVEEHLTKTLKTMYKDLQIKETATVLIIGLGNDQSTPDSLGPKTIDHILVTRHLFSLGEVEQGYRNTASFCPSVTGITGIETKDMIEALVQKVKPDFLLVIDALASSSIERLNKTIQITSSGINPGSGIGNNRVELSQKTLKIPVIAIGIPTVVDATTIVNDTIHLLIQQLSYKLENQDNKKLKLVSEFQQNYKNHTKELSLEQKEEVLGMVGTLEEEELKQLIFEVLIPLNYNLMVTPKEIDFLMDKLALLLGNAINKSLHSHFNPTN